MSSARKSLIWIVGGLGAALIAALIVIKIWFTASVFAPIETPMSASADMQPVEVTEMLDPDERIARDMVTPAVPGTPVMPNPEFTLDRSDYSQDLARFIPIEVGMDRYLATDELLLHYNAEPEDGAVRTKVSSSERMINGATLYIIRRSGLADDSIAAEETYALFDKDVLVDFGSRQQCRRGANANSWTTELCP